VSNLIISPTSLPDVLLLEPRVFEDNRGYFIESYNVEKFAQAGISSSFVQDNQSGSHGGVLRGLHYQIQKPQGKLVRVVVGEIYDVAVDIRRNSKTFGKWVGEVISAENRKQLWIPPGFAHGFYVLSEWAEVMYKTTDYYAPQYERTLLWNDAALAIDWNLRDGISPILSAKDAEGLPLSTAELFD
jgi:dTDP-4-dehydrorhamnose 3,5-epimerase